MPSPVWGLSQAEKEAEKRRYREAMVAALRQPQAVSNGTQHGAPINANQQRDGSTNEGVKVICPLLLLGSSPEDRRGQKNIFFKILGIASPEKRFFIFHRKKLDAYNNNLILLFSTVIYVTMIRCL